jgi:hypothetical protein
MSAGPKASESRKATGMINSLSAIKAPMTSFAGAGADGWLMENTACCRGLYSDSGD